MAGEPNIGDLRAMNSVLCECLESLNQLDRAIDSYSEDTSGTSGALQESVNAVLAKLGKADQ